MTPDQQELLDRLVDGELPDAERRQLLASFEGRPDGWRRCALAFLEAQCWRGAVQEQSRESVAAERRAAGLPLTLPSPARGEGKREADSARGEGRRDAASMKEEAPVSLRPSRWWSAPAGGLPLAMAASFLVAFSLAWVIRQPTLVTGVMDDASVAGGVANLGAVAAAPSVGNSAGHSPTEVKNRWGTVTLVMDDAQHGKQEIPYPVVEGEAADDAWMKTAEPVVPHELREALERLGHHVEQRRQLVPVDLQDGRRLVVPVDEVEFTPVSTRAYQ